MSVREPFSWIEIDVDGCSLTFGEGDCLAELGVDGVKRKCYNLLNTCRSLVSFDHTPVFRTLRYCQPRSNMPKGLTFYPVMLGSPSEVSATVNIAGSDSDLSAFGRRATISTSLIDFPDHDRYLDPYQRERVSGAAQIDEPDFNPRLRGTHFGRLKTRWPFYSGRPYRRCDGYLVDGELVDVAVRHYVITNIKGPGNDDRVVIEGSDILDLADDKRTRAPAASNGVLLDGIGIEIGIELTLDPEGVGDLEYPASGRARIGSEIVEYTRDGDLVTLTSRGVSNTSVSGHQSGDTFQVVLSFVNTRVDDAASILLQAAGVSPDYLPLADWAAEVTRWLPSTRVTRDVTEPTGIKTLISSMVPLGFSLFWSSKDQEIKFKANRPVDGEVIWNLSDISTNLEVQYTEEDKKRVANVLFWTVQKSPIASASSTDNYQRVWSAIEASSYEESRYRGGEVKSYPCPWLNSGSDSIVRVAARRLLKRFSSTPKKFEIELDFRYKGIQLTDVVQLVTGGLQDETGASLPQLYQVIERSEPKAGERLRVTVQSYQFSGRSAFATANDVPTYVDATEAQRDPGMFAADPSTLKMPNGDQPYEAI